MCISLISHKQNSSKYNLQNICNKNPLYTNLSLWEVPNMMQSFRLIPKYAMSALGITSLWIQRKLKKNL